MDSCDRFYDDSLLFNEVFMTLLCKMVPKSPNYSNCRAGYALGTAALLLLAPVSRWTGDLWSSLLSDEHWLLLSGGSQPSWPRGGDRRSLHPG